MLRRAGFKDAASMAAMEKEIFSSPWSEGSIIDSMENSCFTFYVLTDDNDEKLIAYSGMYKVNDEGFVANIACSCDYRGKGYGKSVTARLIERGREQDLYSLSLEVRESNSVAISLYISLGFENVGIRKNFYQKPTENAVIMTYYYRGNS